MVEFVKEGLGDLAIFGGVPLFNAPLHVGRPNDVDSTELLRRIVSALDRKWLTNDGPLVRQLEIKLANFLGVNHCVAVSSATIGLQLVAKALRIEGQVLLPSFTFIGVANALAWIGLEPVFCDVDAQSHNLSPADVCRKANGATSAILGVHLWGRACNVEELDKIARKLGVPLIFDAAHAIGCSYRGQPVGRWGDAAVFSLHATKCVTSLEGGVIATNNSALANEIRLLRNFGFVAEDRVDALGINAKMNEFSAAMGLTSLESYPRLQSLNRRIHEVYRGKFADLGNVRMVNCEDAEAWNYHYAILELLGEDARWRDTLQQILSGENVLARRYFSPGIHRSFPYFAATNYRVGTLPVTERLAASLLALPTGTQMSLAGAARIGDLIRFCYQHRKEIEYRMPAAADVAIDIAEIEVLPRRSLPVSAKEYLATKNARNSLRIRNRMVRDEHQIKSKQQQHPPYIVKK